jgi:hypothetical protein
VGKIRSEIELAVALDQMIELLIDLMQFDAQFLCHLDKVFHGSPFNLSSFRHVDEIQLRGLKNFAHDRFGHKRETPARQFLSVPANIRQTTVAPAARIRKPRESMKTRPAVGRIHEQRSSPRAGATRFP